MKRHVTLTEQVPPVLRLGLSTRGNTHLTSSDVRLAMDRGVNYLNWCGQEDGLSRAVARLSREERERVVVAYQFSARTAAAAESELAGVLETLDTDYLDVPTLYYVESEPEWEEICSRGGSLAYLTRAKEAGRVRMVGLTSHQRKLAARWAGSGRLDLLMIRYNAAHRGAEEDVFPVTRELDIPVVAFTCLRWRYLLEPQPGENPDRVPPAMEWYRFVVANPAVGVALMAPNGKEELLHNLSLLDDWRASGPETLARLRVRGDRVRERAGNFP